eukprot:GSChrysophyteH1.ASY1.ANO1.1445.1 assembled CDS
MPRPTKLTARNARRSTEAKESSTTSPAPPHKYPHSHEFEKGIQEVQEAQDLIHATELEKMKDTVFHEEKEREIAEKALRELRQEDQMIKNKFHRKNISLKCSQGLTESELKEHELPLPKGLKFRDLRSSNERTNDGIAGNAASAARSARSARLSSSRSTSARDKSKKVKADTADQQVNALSAVPRNLNDAAKRINLLAVSQPDVIENAKVDLEVLLGNKCAAGAAREIKEKEALQALVDQPIADSPKTPKGKGRSAKPTTPVTKPSSPSVKERRSSQAALNSLKVPATARPNLLANDRGISFGNPGSRFGGGLKGRVLMGRKEKKDILRDVCQPTGSVSSLSVKVIPPGGPGSPVSPGSPATATVQTTEDALEGAESKLDVTSRLMGLPGHLNMTISETEKYFGEQSRVNFFNRVHWLDHQRKITNFYNVPDTDMYGHYAPVGTTRTLAFEQHETFGAEHNPADIPFGPVRPNVLPIGAPESYIKKGMEAPRLVNSRPISPIGSPTTDFAYNLAASKRGNVPADTTVYPTHEEYTANPTTVTERLNLRGSSKDGRGGLFSPGNEGFGMDTYRHKNRPLQFAPLGMSKMFQGDALNGGSSLCTIASTGTAVPGLNLPTRDSHKADAARIEAETAKKLEEAIKLTHEDVTTHITAAKDTHFSHALHGIKTSQVSQNPGETSTRQADGTRTSKQLERDIDENLSVADFIADHLHEGKTISAQKLAKIFKQGVSKGDYSFLGGNFANSRFKYVSTRQPAYAPVDDDDAFDESSVPKYHQDGSPNMNHSVHSANFWKLPSAKEVLDREEQADFEALEAEIEAIMLQRKVIIDGNKEIIPGYDIGESSVGSLTAVEDIGKPISPRSKYIDSCIRDGVNPRASVVIRRGLTKVLDLSHHGIGDKMGDILAGCILELPYLQSINIRDNGLTDKSLGPIVKALVEMQNILQVDLSQNVVGDVASNTLSTYLGSPGCPIERLVMRNADVDDFECERFVTAIRNNTKSNLKEVDLSQNLLGSAEQLNVVMPELTTAGEAFAELLEESSCQLQKLELGWNMIRGDSAVAFCNALQINTSLINLNISYNSLGKEGGRALGQSLLENQTLTHLDISSNGLDGTAIFCICVGLIENKTMRRIILDGNPIGGLGARAVMQVPVMIGSRCKISVANCNIAIPAENDPKDGEAFDFDNLLRVYHLDMTSAFHRAQAFMILYIVACHHTFTIPKWEEEIKGQGKRTVDLVPFLNPDKQEYFTDKQKEVEESLETTIRAASDVDLAVKFFNDIDVDGSGELDRDEFRQLMDRIGIDLDDERLEDVFDTYDTDQGGTIGVDEFLVFLRRQKVETESRLYDLTQTPAFCEKKDLAFNTKDNVIQRKYVPSKNGKCTVVVEDSFKRKAIFRTVTSSDKDFIEDIAAAATDAVSMTTFGVAQSKLRLDEALGMYQTMALENANKSKILAKILPSLNSAKDAQLLVAKVLKNNRQEMLSLKQTLGVAVRPLLGMYNGYYELDLSVPLDRLCLMRLLEVSSSKCALLKSMKKHPLHAKGARPFDASQKRNQSCFRNEIFNNERVVVDTSFATPLPKRGLLCFDFSGGELPHRDDMICSDQRVVKILNNLHCLPSMKCEDALRKLDRYSELVEMTMKGNGTTIYEASYERGMSIGDYMEEFYEKLPQRSAQLEQAKEKEDILIRISLEPDAFKTKGNLHDDVCTKIPFTGSDYIDFTWDTSVNGSMSLMVKVLDHDFHSDDDSVGKLVIDLNESRENLEDSQPALLHHLKLQHENGNVPESGQTYLSLDITLIDISREQPDGSGCRLPNGTILGKGLSDGAVIAAGVGESAAESKSREQIDVENQDADLTPSRNVTEADADARMYSKLQPQKRISNAAKAVRIMEALDDSFSKLWLLCRHVTLILECFAYIGKQPRTQSFGSYRVDLCCLLFERIIDVHNFELVLRVLEPFEVAALICRIGWLNFFNPMKPEGGIQLNLGRYEERVIAKILCVLAITEPGNNWTDYQFRWKFDDDPVPGWELTDGWVKQDGRDEGLPCRGILSCYYYSGEGVKLQGCKPHISLRKALMYLTFLSEHNVRKEEEWSVPVTKDMRKELYEKGAKYMLNNQSIFLGYALLDIGKYLDLKAAPPPTA